MADAALAAGTQLALGITMPAGIDPGCVSGNHWTTGAAILTSLDAFTNDLANRIGVTGSTNIAKLAPASFAIYSTFGVTARAAPFPQGPPDGGAQGGLFPDTTLMDGLRDRGITPMVYMEPDTVTFAAIVNGDYDAYLNTWADAANVWRNESTHIGQKNDKGRYKDSTIIYRFAQEMNKDWMPWGIGGSLGNTSIPEFVTAWRRMRNILVRKAPHIKMFYCPWGDGNPSPADMYPGNAYCQYVGFDMYDFDGVKSLATTMQASLNNVRAYAGTRKKIIVGEYGIYGGGTKAIRDAFITQGLPWARKQGIKGMVYSDYDARDVCDGSGHIWGLSTTRRAYALRANQTNFQGRYGSGDKPASQAAAYGGSLPDDDDADITSNDNGGMDIAVATYQEGTFTPTLQFGTVGNLAVGYGIRVGRYTRIGNRVFYTMVVTTTSFTHTTASGAFLISGLPFTVANVANDYSSGAITMDGWTLSGYTGLVAIPEPNTLYLQIQAYGSTKTRANLTTAHVLSGGTPSLIATGHYEV